MARARGKKPKPTHLKVVSGTARSGRLNENEPQPELVLPEPPEHLSAPAKAEWERVSGELYTLGILTGLDRATLAAYCQAYGRWVEAETLVADMAALNDTTKGLMVRTTNGNAIQNPMVGTANKAMADMVRYATDLGMTPSARSRINADPPTGGKDPAAKYFR